ncbi:DNA polymerase III, epsilon subunit and related 3'-5' exonuclease [Methylophaga aminisulfidivorans MP]|uniref:DNA polymerase III subunit epsilon n=1 Tax=Methylophaga aminisulfidivorans MP TaxID=1026882 RepID=F5SYP9_9GAMM|nr:DNA polymerase III subunit epsilon [Methylophaga aminisulfidivorans]EGL54534.1 DNA polymerase III, epsilon subunit and related 3'-5' exonuclease [Methylophaga aminisulfidivorans MP]
MAENVVKRQVILDTETTGISTAEDHRIIEIGCVEMVNRRLTGQTFHQYINPHREIDAGAIEVHGITNEFLADKPSFEDIAEDFLQFIEGAELIIHNAPFDVGFIDHELKKLSGENRRVNSLCTVLDTLKMARDKHPGQKNNLDALCKRYDVDNSNRELHGALLDAEILADVYLAMTGGQVSMLLAANEEETVTSTPSGSEAEEVIATVKSRNLKVIRASEEELAAHEAMLEKVQKSSGGECVWLRES